MRVGNRTVILAVAIGGLAAAALAQSPEQRAADQDPASRVVANASELLNYKIEGVSLNTAPDAVESILMMHGYRRTQPVEPPKLGHTTFIYVKGDAAGVSPGGTQFSAPNGFAYEIMIMLSRVQSWQDPRNAGRMYIQHIRYRRLPPISVAGKGVTLFNVDGPLPQTPDRKILLDLKAYLCARMSDKALLASHCSRNLDDQVFWAPSGEQRLRDGKVAIQVKLRAVRSRSELALIQSTA